MVAEVIINSNVKTLNRIFDYNVPINMEENIKIGSRIFVPFGNSKNLEEGFVVGFKEKSEYKVKDVAKIQEENSISKEKIKLAKYMALKYFCNISDCLKLMLPPGTLSKNIDSRIKEKTTGCVDLKLDNEEIEELITTEKIKNPRQIRILKFLMENEGVTTSDLETFADTTLSTIKTMEKNGLIEIIQKQIDRNPFLHKVITKTSNLEFTEEQQKAFDEISNNINKFNEYLIFGVTGSRKNRNILTTYSKCFKRK